jgi:superfamily II DNA/RNA helicase
VDIKTQTPHLKTGVEILVATPGRLLDHIEQKSVQLNLVQMLVLDEADRMLDMGFMPALKRILALLPKQRQNLMFSATFSNEIKKLSEEFLNDPALIEVARSNATSENITQKVYLVEQHDKHALLAQLLRGSCAAQALVFTKTKLTASRLTRQLQKEGVAADEIHGDKSQLERMQALDAFKQGKVTVLIATDVAARGLDIDSLPMVINYEIPHAAEDYVHRIGRTGRAGALGTAISLVSPEEEKYLLEIEKLIGREIQKERAEMPAPVAKPAHAPRAAPVKSTGGESAPVEPERVAQPSVAPLGPVQEVAAPSPRVPDKPAVPPAPAAGKPRRAAWHDQPYVPGASSMQPKPAEAPFGKPKKEVPALFVRKPSPKNPE